MTNHETYYSVDNKLRVLHTQPWSSSSSFYVHQPSSSVYSHSGDSNSEYKHQTTDANHGPHQDLGGKKIKKKYFSLDFDSNMIKSQM